MRKDPTAPMIDQENAVIMDHLASKRNITFAVNYEVSMVDQFLASSDRKRRVTNNVATCKDSTSSTSDKNPSALSTGQGRRSSRRRMDQSLHYLPDPDEVDRHLDDNSDSSPQKRPHHDDDASGTSSSHSYHSSYTYSNEIEPSSSREKSHRGHCNEQGVSTQQHVSISFASSFENNRQSSEETARRSTRGKQKRETALARARVRYDMQVVPQVRRNREFLDQFPRWWMPQPPPPSVKIAPENAPSTPVVTTTTSAPVETAPVVMGTPALVQIGTASIPPQDPAPADVTIVVNDAPLEKQGEPALAAQYVGNEQPKHSSRFAASTGDERMLPVSHDQHACSLPCSGCEEFKARKSLSPFEDDSSVIWIPSKRSEWEDTVAEMTAVCTSAALRRFVSAENSTAAKPFHAPLSRDYIRDRVDIDDPLNGYQIRHKTGGWLQGFIMWTNFTTWTHYFKWDSRHVKCGFAVDSIPRDSRVDLDGSLAEQLELQPRSGDPHGGGIVFPALAEIALVGGLGCGEYLLRMALDSIRLQKQYKYVVLQATDQSKSFYERFGFVRVGAVCRYKVSAKTTDATAASESNEAEGPIIGYRHWTHANESESSLLMHGGPSYMMCLKLPEFDIEEGDSHRPECCPCCGKHWDGPKTFLKHMLTLRVEQKPTIEQLGATATPVPKGTRRGSMVSAASNASMAAATTGTTVADGADTVPTSIVPKKKRGRKPKRKNAVADTSQAVNARPPEAQRLLQNFPSADAGMTREPARSRAVSNSDEPVIRPAKRVKLDIPASIVAQDQPVPIADIADADPAVLPEPVRVRKGFDASRHKSTRSQNSVQQTRTSPRVLVAAASQVLSSNSGKTPKPLQKIANSAESISMMALTSQHPNVSSDDSDDTPASLIPLLQAGKNRKPQPIEKGSFHKQKVKSYPRSRVHYFNRVVKPIDGRKVYYFVTYYDDTNAIIRIVPMEPRGRLSGKREGRPRFQAIIDDTDHNFLTAPADQYQVVQAVMVMKTPVISQEASDIEDD